MVHVLVYESFDHCVIVGSCIQPERLQRNERFAALQKWQLGVWKRSVISLLAAFLLFSNTVGF